MAEPIDIELLDPAAFQRWQADATPEHRRWATLSGFSGEAGQSSLLPANDGSLAGVLAGAGRDAPDTWSIAHLVDELPSGRYRLAQDVGAALEARLAIGFELARYRFDRYVEKSEPAVELVLREADESHVARRVTAVRRVRDLVNTPADDMGPEQLSEVLEAIAEEYGADFRAIVGDDLLAANLPAIHAVGRAAAQAPRLLILDWGREEAPKLTLVGKGVCFDSGGLNIKPAAGMRIMKKDMGGAAHVIALAEAIMDAELDVRLQVLVPSVENAISGNAYRPGDVVATRAGLSVEIGNTDAEGRVILCDALKLACERTPELIIDFATLTGAARIALGPDLPPLFGNDQSVVDALLASGLEFDDPLWQMPLFDGYDAFLDSTVADLGNVAETPFAGCITAALYLRRFIDEGQAWCHLDVYAWNQRARPGRPAGGEAHGLRAIFEYLVQRYGA